MEISLKVQNIGAGYDPEATKDTVITHEFSIPSDQLLKKRGRLFITLKIGTNGDFDLKDVASIFLDSVQENYYRLTEETPLHALEKALNRAIKLVLTIKSRDESISLGSVEANFKLSFATAIIWNKVLYTSYLGNPAVYLVRGTGVRNLSLTPATNEIWTNSGILDNQDVVIIGTEAFAKAFPSNEIINSLGNISYTIANHSNKNELAAMLIKVSTSGEQNLSIAEKMSGAKLKEALSSAYWKVKTSFSENDKLSDRFKFYQNKKTAPVSSISGLTAPSATPASVNMLKGPKRASNSKSKKGKKRIAVGLTMVAISLLAINHFVIKPLSLIPTDDINANISLANTETSQVMGSSTAMTAPNTALTTEIHEEFFNTSSFDNSPTIIGLSSTSKTLTVLDASTQALYTINPETKESTEIFKESSMPLFLECDTRLCYIADSGIFYVLDPEDSQKVDKYPHRIDGLADIAPYNNDLYLLSDNQIYSQRIGGTTNAEAKEWLGTNEPLNGAKAMAIDGNIYVLTENAVFKFYGGKTVSGFNLDFSKLQNPVNLEVYNGKLYILDGTKIQVFNKATGSFIETIELTNDIVNPNFFTLTKFVSNKIIFEKGKILYEVKL